MAHCQPFSIVSMVSRLLHFLTQVMIVTKKSFSVELNTKEMLLVFSGKFNISKDRIPRNFTLHPKVSSGNATSLVLKWKTMKSQSAIVYVISVRKSSNDGIMRRKRRVSYIL